ncbi:hypothetical protein VV869_00940 [Photobacterium sp. MCCC 1A19761]|uniref:hypothetical protein n=1 Tax=Photobacterium sp. MCCC 1A19761 TaxID=3115000 RepID=UPI00307FC28C
MMKTVLAVALWLLFCSTATAKSDPFGQSKHQLIRMQTIDPLAETRVPEGPPRFSGKKASKSINTEQKGLKSEKVKEKNMIVSK